VLQAVGIKLVEMLLMIVINKIKIVNKSLATHKRMWQVSLASTTNGGKQRLGLCGMAICPLSARSVGLVIRFLQNGSGEEHRKEVK
jgi:hypothetical protein